MLLSIFDMIDLIIFDMAGTIIYDIKDVKPRNGFYSFLDRYEKIRKALCTDSLLGDVNKALRILDARYRFNIVYTFDNLIEINGAGHKDLKGLMRESNSKEAVFITDGAPYDIEDAQKEGIKCIRVPYFYDYKEKFSFDFIDLEKDLPSYTDMRNINL